MAQLIVRSLEPEVVAALKPRTNPRVRAWFAGVA